METRNNHSETPKSFLSCGDIFTNKNETTKQQSLQDNLMYCVYIYNLSFAHGDKDLGDLDGFGGFSIGHGSAMVRLGIREKDHHIVDHCRAASSGCSDSQR
jgi:hypothetical protein